MKVHARARQWSRAAWGLAALFGSLPLSSRLFLGAWGFEGAGELACLCLALGVYLHLVGRRGIRVVPDAAAALERAISLAARGQIDDALALLKRTIRQNPRFWQAYQYRGDLHYRQQQWDAALGDFNEAIRLAPHEATLFALRARVHAALGDESAAQQDWAAAAALAEQDGQRPA